ncbi:MAG: hypothetical protein JWM11_1144 [Planctomycetaceae bacterium]|nr:hypothetical protein [Planctomycetaceae bacterium]
MSDEHAHDAHHVNYTGIFVLLCICTALSIVFDVGKPYLSRAALLILVLGVATTKATFVLLYFMHIKFETGWKYVLLAPTMVLACCVPFALAPDIAYHYYEVIVPQSYVMAEEHVEGHGAAAHSPVEHKAESDTHGDHQHDDKHAVKKADDHKAAHPTTTEKK